MLRLAAAAAVLLLAASSHAARLTWTGCNTNFYNPMNWASSDSLPWMTADGTPVTTVYFSDPAGEAFNPVNSFVKEGTYEMYELVLPEDGILTLSPEGSELVFYEQEETAGSAVFIAGQPERMRDDACNFKCHKAWKLGYGTDNETPSPDPPCDDDVAVFPPENTYRVLAQGLINIRELQMDGATIENKNSIPEYQMTPAGNNLKMFIGNNDNCFESGLLDEGACLCHSQCADEERFREQDKQIRDIVKAIAEQDLEETLAPQGKAFDAEFQLASIYTALGVDVMTNDVIAPAQCLYATAAEREGMRKLFMQTIMKRLPGAEVTDLETSFDGAVVHVRSQNVTVPLATVSRVNADGSLGAQWWGEDETMTGRYTGPNMLMVHLWEAYVKAAVACLPTRERNQLGADTMTCAADLSTEVCEALRDLGSNLKAGAAPAQVFAALVAGIEAHMDEMPTSFNETNNATAPIPHEFDLVATGFASASAAMLASANVVYDGLKAGLDGGNVTHWGTKLAQQIQAVADAQSDGAAQDRVPTQTGAFSTTMVVGRNLPQADLNRLVDKLNREPLAKFIADRLAGIPPILSIDWEEVALAIINEQFEGGDDDEEEEEGGAEKQGQDKDRRRRRRDANPNTSGQAHSPLEVTFEYEMVYSLNCPAVTSRTDCPLNAAGGGPYTLVMGTLDDIVASYEVVTPKCYDIETGNDLECATREAINFINQNRGLSQSQLQQALADLLNELLDCPSSECSEEEQEAINAIIADASASAQAATEDEEAGIPIAAVAGAAAGVVVLIIIVVIIVVRRRRRSGAPGGAGKGKAAAGKGGAADRTVVAFENPMYDDPTNAPAAIYDEAAGGVGGGDDEGLYDEPAFNADKSKENPMYQSNENLAEGGMGDDGAPPEEGGYLDVAPDDGDDE